MTAGALPARIARFLGERVCTASRLELLLAVFRTADRWQSAEALARQLGMAPDLVASNLEQLCAAGLLDVRIAESLIYRAGADPETHALLDETATLYYRDRDLVLSAFARGGSRSAALFARAFDLRRKPE